MNTSLLFTDHCTTVNTQLADAIRDSGTECDGVLIHSGSSHMHYADDHACAFRAWGHFLRYVPVDRPDQFVLLIPGNKPCFFPLIPTDFWHDQHLDMPSWWADCFEICPLSDLSELPALISNRGRLAFLGEGVELATSLGISQSLVNPAALLNWLDFERAYKTPYEVHRLADANVHALAGHQAAQDAFLDGGSEFDIHMAYLIACQVLDQELPYSSIVALNAHAATLHYQHKQRGQHKQRDSVTAANSTRRQSNQVLLIDAGCRAYGYCSDITRTWVAPGVHPVFLKLLAGMEALQSRIINEISPGNSYLSLHQATHQLLAELLIDSGLCRGTPDQLVDKGVTYAFFPHGLGHLLGLQVHDVGGRQTDRHGTLTPPPAAHPALRTTRVIETGMVFTIEPGLYFIPALLDPLQASAHSRLVNWAVVDDLLPLGGIRIEDNIWVGPKGTHNLTRQGF
jgi:Xaa-Pro dipeptidase